MTDTDYSESFDVGASGLDQIFESFHRKLCKIDALEVKVNERAVRARRRITNILEAQPRFRSSHLRLFVTHSVEDVLVPLEQEPPPPAQQQQQTREEWRLNIEGRLLIDHLDHESATEYDKKTNYKPPMDDLDRSKGEQEEEKIDKVNATHLFDQVTVEFQPVFQPRPNPMSRKPTPKKSSRRGCSKSPTANALLEDEVDPNLLIKGKTTQLEWNRAMTADAHSWSFLYSPPPPPEHRYMPHSIVATIQLCSRKATEVYTVSKELAALFTSHGPDDHILNRKRRAEATVEGAPQASPSPPPLDNSISIPQGLSMKEICLGIYNYIIDRDLIDPASIDKSIIQCNDQLKSVFGVEQFPFHQLHQLLLSRNLLESITKEPVELVYIMNKFTATPSLPDLELGEQPHALLQLDMDVSVPSLFPYRAREILRRIKRRELEYTSSRTKARYILMSRKAKSEEVVKSMIEEAVNGHSLNPDMQLVLAALAKAAPPKTEARMAAHYDARMSYLLTKLREHQQAARTAWDLARACGVRDNSQRDSVVDDCMDLS